MPLMPSRIEPSEVENILIDEFGDFHSSIKTRLGIEDVTYSLEIKEYGLSDGSVKNNTLASGIPNSEGTGIVKIVFFSTIIANKINQYYSRISNRQPAFIEAAKVVTRSTIVHELVHIRQFKNGLTMEQYKQIHYYENPWEDEARRLASQILSEKGDFESEVINVFDGSINLVDANLEHFISLYENKSGIE